MSGGRRKRVLRIGWMLLAVLHVAAFLNGSDRVLAQVPSENSLLWEINTPGNAKPSYLFGTIHLICPTDFSLSDSLKAALARTQQVALEIDMDDPGMMMSMMKSMNMKEGNELKKLLSEQEYAKVEQFYKDSVGIGLQMFGQAKPLILLGPLFNAVLACQPQSYEMSLVDLAKKQQSEVIGIETLDEQMAIFDSIPYKDQAKMIVAIIDSLPKARKEFHDLVRLYKSQNINELYRATLSSEFAAEGNEALMLSGRNQKWIGRMQKIIAAKPTFFAVGAAHLGGEKGVITLLRQNGFKVRPIL